MAFAAATRRNLASRGLSNLVERRLYPSIPQLLPSSSTGDPRQASPLPPKPAPRSFHFGILHFGTSQTLNFLPFGLHLFPGPPRRSFSSSSRDPDFSNVLTDAAHAAAPAAASASFPGEVARAAEDSSMAVAAVQHLIDAVHSFTGLNWWISIALSTVLLRCVVSTLWMLSRKRAYMTRHDLQQFGKLAKNAKDDASRREAANRIIENLGLLSILPPIVTTYTIVTLYSSISNMVDKVPSLNGGGAFWFTDLTTPDALCIFPMIMSLFIMLRLEVGNSSLRRCKGCTRRIRKVKMIWRAISLLSMLWIATLPQVVRSRSTCFYLESFVPKYIEVVYMVENKILTDPIRSRHSFQLPLLSI